jgi:tRNA(Ile)-lysidine synthetase-like protein
VGLAFREDTSNPDTKRGLIRAEILPLLEQLDPRARASCSPSAPTPSSAAAARGARRAASFDRTRRPGGGSRRRSYGTLRLDGAVTWGPWRLESDVPGLVVRSRRAGDRLAGRSRKVQDVLVDAKVPRDERDGWPLVATEDGAVVAVVGLEDAPGWEGAVRAARTASREAR